METNPDVFVGFPKEVSGFATIRSLQDKGIRVSAYDTDKGSAGLYVKGLENRYVFDDIALNESFLKSLLDLGDENARPVLIDLESAAIDVIGRNQGEIKKRFRLLMPSYDILDIALDKAKTAELFLEHSLGAPQTLKVDKKSDIGNWKGTYPAVFKPRKGKGGRGQIVVRSEDEAKAIWDEHNFAEGEYILQEWIPGPAQNLFTVGMLCAPEGRVRGLFSGQRLDVVQTRKIPEGVTSYARSVKVPEILKAAKEFAEISGWEGMAELEFKKDERDGTYKILEINPRFWAWVRLPIVCGVDFPYMYYQIATKGDCEPVLDFKEDVQYFRSILHFYTQNYRLFSGKIGVGKYLSQLLGPYVQMFRCKQFVWEDFRFRREYFKWIRFYMRDSVH